MQAWINHLPLDVNYWMVEVVCHGHHKQALYGWVKASGRYLSIKINKQLFINKFRREYVWVVSQHSLHLFPLFSCSYSLSNQVKVYRFILKAINYLVIPSWSKFYMGHLSKEMVIVRLFPESNFMEQKQNEYEVLPVCISIRFAKALRVVSDDPSKHWMLWDLLGTDDDLVWNK